MLSHGSFFFSPAIHRSSHDPDSTLATSHHTATVPIQFAPETPTPLPVLLAPAPAATRIQAAYRSHLARTLVRRVAAVDSEATRFEALIRQQHTVDAVRRDGRERLRVGEGLMALLLRLDSVPGLYPAVRDLRRSVSRRIVGLQEVLDAVAGETVVGLEGFPATWEDVVFGIDGVGCDGRIETTDDKGFFDCAEIEGLLSEF